MERIFFFKYPHFQSSLKSVTNLKSKDSNSERVRSVTLGTHFLTCSLPSEHHNNFRQRICIWKILLTPASPLSGPHLCTWTWNALNLCSSMQWYSIFQTSVQQYKITGFCVALQCSWISRSTQNMSSVLYVQRLFYPWQIEEEWTCLWYSCVRASLI